MTDANAWYIVGADIWHYVRFFLPPMFWALLPFAANENAETFFSALIIAVLLTYWSYQ